MATASGSRTAAMTEHERRRRRLLPPARAPPLRLGLDDGDAWKAAPSLSHGLLNGVPFSPLRQWKRRRLRSPQQRQRWWRDPRHRRCLALLLSSPTALILPLFPQALTVSFFPFLFFFFFLCW
ncbi:uncharacterized protein DS421_10g308770 [Arachis hypogaea]|nr:uncharacterized protein DS421_10g308770 [Arachis hypogaea]